MAQIRQVHHASDSGAERLVLTLCASMQNYYNLIYREEEREMVNYHLHYEEEDTC